MILATLLALFLMVLFRWQSARRIIVKYCFRFVLLLINIRYSITRKVKTKGKIIAGVHTSYVDILVYEALIDGSFTAKAEVKSWPLWGWGARMINSVFVERVGRSALDNFILAATKAVTNNINLFVFPEGTTSDNPLKSFKIGAFRLSKETGHGIIPVVAKYSNVEKIAWVGEMSFLPHVVRMFGSYRWEKVKLTVLDELLPENFEDEKEMRDFAKVAMQSVYNDEKLQRKDVTYNDIFKTEGLSQREIVQHFLETQNVQTSEVSE